MLILEQWPRQIAPAAGRTLASNFRVLRLDQPAGQPSQVPWTTPVKVGVSPRMGRVYHSYTATTALLPGGLCSALLCSVVLLVVLCQVRVPRTGPGPGRELQANAPGRKAVSPQGAEMGSETCLLRASSVKGSAGEHGAPPEAPSIA